MRTNFEPMRKQVEARQECELIDVTTKVVIYEAFVEGKLEAPKHLARTEHDLNFEPKHEEFRPRTIWSLSNAFTFTFKELDPLLQFRATAKLGEFLWIDSHSHLELTAVPIAAGEDRLGVRTPNVKSLQRQLRSMFNPEAGSGEFGL